MTKTGVSIIVYSVYLASSGAGMALVPNFMFGLLGLPPTTEVWPRMFGALAMVLGAKGIKAALLNLVDVMQFDVYTRVCFSVFLTALILLHFAAPILILFAVIDFVFAVWTQWTIIAAKRKPVQKASRAGAR